MDQQFSHDAAEVERSCIRLIHELALRTDAGDHDQALAVFTHDAVMDRDGERFEGIDALRAAFAARPANRRTRHVISNTLVRMVNPGLAEATSYVTVYRHWVSGPDEKPPFETPGADVLGEYHDLFKRTDVGWRLCSRMTRTLLRFTHPTETVR